MAASGAIRGVFVCPRFPGIPEKMPPKKISGASRRKMVGIFASDLVLVRDFPRIFASDLVLVPDFRGISPSDLVLVPDFWDFRAQNKNMFTPPPPSFGWLRAVPSVVCVFVIRYTTHVAYVALIVYIRLV